MLYELMLRYLTSHFIRNYDYTFYTITLLILRKKFSFGLEFADLFENWIIFSHTCLFTCDVSSTKYHMSQVSRTPYNYTV